MENQTSIKIDEIEKTITIVSGSLTITLRTNNVNGSVQGIVNSIAKTPEVPKIGDSIAEKIAKKVLVKNCTPVSRRGQSKAERENLKAKIVAALLISGQGMSLQDLSKRFSNEASYNYITVLVTEMSKEGSVTKQMQVDTRNKQYIHVRAKIADGIVTGENPLHKHLISESQFKSTLVR